MSKNIAASVRARLKNHSDAAKQDFNLTLTHYGLERLLYRLSMSEHAQNFLLKGALLFTLWYDFPHRSTRDADFLGFGPNDINSVTNMFYDICNLAFDDGIEFDPRSIKGTEIRKDAGYGGIRIELRAKLDQAIISLQVDIGFGDAVTPGPEWAHYPVLLNDFPAPHLRVYPKYTVIAEKFHALCVLGMANSRMKDYFDLWILLRDEALVASELRQAIEATFTRRQTPLPKTIPIGLSETFANDIGKQNQWNAFIKKNKLEFLSLGHVTNILRNKLCIDEQTISPISINIK